MSLLGIDWTIYRIDGTYEYNEVVKALGAHGYVKRNLNPMVQTSRTAQYDVVDKGKYIGTAVFDYKIGPIDNLSYQLGSFYIQVYGDKNGKTGGAGWTE